MARSHRDCANLIRRCVPFKAGNVYAEHVNGLYVVYSYGGHYPMAVLSERGWMVNDGDYSRSTNNQTRKTEVKSLPGVELADSGVLRAIINQGTAEYRREKAINRVTQRLSHGVRVPEAVAA